MGRVYRWTPGVMALAVALAVAACGGGADDRGPANTNVAAPATTQVVSDTTRAVVGDQVVAPDEPHVEFRRPVSYLDEVIPPCVPLEGSSADPCEQTLRWVPAIRSAPSAPPIWPYDDSLPTLTEVMMGFDALTITHIVVRATVLDDTTRCDLYPLILAYYTTAMSYPGLYRYNCYVDVRVNEYLVGTGPAELTVELHREVLSLGDDEFEDWDNWKDDWLTDVVDDPQARTAEAFEGNELVLLLTPSFTLAVEAWEGADGIADVWFVQRPDEGSVRAVASEVSLAITDDQRNSLDMLLADLVTKLEAAATELDNEYDGRIGEDTDLPDLIDDANNLRDFLVESGAVYRGPDKTTELPPPVGGPPEAPTNVALTQKENRWFVTWDAAETGGEVYLYYLMFRSTRSDGGVTLFNNSVTLGAETEFDITFMRLYFGTEFTVQVRAWNTAGYSDWTTTTTLTIPTTSTSSTTSTTRP